MLTFVLSITILSYNVYSHECIHHKIVKNIDKIDKGNPRAFLQKKDRLNHDERMLSENTWRKINITFDTSLLQNESDELKTYLTNTTLPRVKAIFESFLYVRGDTKIPQFYNTMCDHIFKVPKSYSSIETESDLLIFVDTVEDSSNYLAYALSCKYEPTYNRPSIGVIRVNKSNLVITGPNLQSFVFVLTHELVHILVFSQNHYSLYYGRDNVVESEVRNTPDGRVKVQKLVTPKVLAAAKEHFNCSSITGVYLEDEGHSVSVGNHFEKTKFGHELMTAQITGYPVISNLTLALMEDSGWYQVDYSKSQFLSFGNQAGCPFYEDHCSADFPEFCKTDTLHSCSSDYISKGKCRSTDYSNKCYLINYHEKHVCVNPYNFSKTVEFEESGANSRCFNVKQSNKDTAACFKSYCEAGKVLIQLQEDVIECSISGELIKYENLEITCPDISKFCAYYNRACNDDCNGQGTCLNDKTCRCDYFYSGPTCAISKGCEPADALICDALASNEISIVKITISAIIALLLSLN